MGRDAKVTQQQLIKSSPRRRGRPDHPGCSCYWEPTGSTGAAPGGVAGTEVRAPSCAPALLPVQLWGGKRHCHLPRNTREVTAVPAVLSTVPGTHRGAQQQHPSCRGWPGLGLCHGHPVTFIVSPPWGWLCPHFLASPTPSTELDAHSCCWPSPKCGSALWVSPCPPTACTPVEHPRHGGSTLAERGQLAAPPRAAFVRSLWAS